MPASAQEAVFAFLADPASHAGQSVERIDTHISAVFLAGERALKVKRAVRFPYLDFTSLAKRRAACLAELQVNRRFAPTIYLGVVPITREDDGRLKIGGSGEVIEWAVEMRRFDEGQTFDRLADAGKIDGALASTLGASVADAHAVCPAVLGTTWPGSLAAVIAENDRELSDWPELFAPLVREALAADSQSRLQMCRAMLSERVEAGLVRQCHGDLHLGNVALVEGQAVPFDAIEFDPALAIGDVLFDLAFLLMDLAERGLAAPANIVLNQYLEATSRPTDLRALQALPLFLSVRAAIRAKVTAARRAGGSAVDRDRLAEAARAYFSFAVRAIRPPPPVLVGVGGLSGTGKSALARALAPALPPIPGAVVLRSDVERKALFGLPPLARLAESGYGREATARTYARLAEKAARVLDAGHSAVVDAVFAQPAERQALAGIAARVGARFVGIFLQADLATRLARVAGRSGDASDAGSDVVRSQEGYRLGAVDWALTDASGTPEATLAAAKGILGLVEASNAG